jgi:hypothetical protein
MSNVEPLAPKRRSAEEKAEFRQLYEVNARVNHGQEHMTVSSAKTLHHGVDLRRGIAKIMALQMQHLWPKERFELGISEEVVYKDPGDALSESKIVRHCIVMAKVKDMYYVLSESEDFIVPLTEYPFKVVETTVDGSIGYWDKVDEINDNAPE